MSIAPREAGGPRSIRLLIRTRNGVLREARLVLGVKPGGASSIGLRFAHILEPSNGAALVAHTLLSQLYSSNKAKVHEHVAKLVFCEGFAVVPLVWIGSVIQRSL